MKLKKDSSTQKLRGAYYTPKVLADFIVKNIEKKDNMKILEPSCGDGVFLESISEYIKDEQIKSVEAIEIINEEAKKVKNRGYGKKYKIINTDF